MSEVVPGFEPGYWDHARKEARNELALSWGWEKSCPGTSVVTATIPSMPMPVGTVWYRFHDHETLTILNSFVWEAVRRCGVRTRLHQYLLEIYPGVRKVETGYSTLDGRGWLQSAGFKRKANGDWYLRVSRSKQNAAA